MDAHAGGRLHSVNSVPSLDTGVLTGVEPRKSDCTEVLVSTVVMLFMWCYISFKYYYLYS